MISKHSAAVLHAIPERELLVIDATPEVMRQMLMATVTFGDEGAQVVGIDVRLKRIRLTKALSAKAGDTVSWEMFNDPA